MGLILPQKVEVKIAYSTVKYYENLGYEIPKVKNKNGKLCCDISKTLLVDIEDLPPQANVKVDCICDYCQIPMKMMYYDYNNKVKNGVIQKVSCKNCRIKKVAESNMRKYNQPYVFTIDEVKDKITTTIRHKYGVDKPAQNKDILNKISSTVQKKYGVPYISLSKELREKATVTYYKYGKQNTSSQQIYINNLFQGKLNYPCKNFNIDIALLEEKIAIEYDGGGHDLCVRIGNITQEEHNQKEIIRNNIIKRAGYKQIRIVSSTDKLPSDTILLKMLDKAKEYFNNTPHTWMEYNIDSSTMRNAEHKEGIYFDFGELRRIKKVS